MKVTLKLYASLQDYLPADAKNHSTEVVIGESDTPYQVLKRFKVPLKMAHLVILNGIYLYPADREKPVLKEGDVLAVWPPVAGG